MSRTKHSRKRGRLCALCTSPAVKLNLCGVCLMRKRTLHIDKVSRRFREEDPNYPRRRRGSSKMPSMSRSTPTATVEAGSDFNEWFAKVMEDKS